MARDATIVKFRGVLFEDMDELTLSEAEREQLARIRAVYTLQLAKPTTPNTELVALLRDRGVKSVSHAYRIIAQTSILLGSVPNASKQWTRYVVVEALKSAIERADRIIDSAAVEDDNEIDDTCEGDALGKFVRTCTSEVVIKAIEAKIKAADKLAKYARLDKSDPEPIPYEEIVPLATEFLTDPSIMGVQVDDPVGLVERVTKKYVDFEVIDNG